MKPRGPYTIHETPMTLSVPLLTPEMWVTCVKCGNRRTLEEIGTVGPIACTCGSTTYETDRSRVGPTGNFRMVSPNTPTGTETVDEPDDPDDWYDCRICRDDGYISPDGCDSGDEWPCICNLSPPPPKRRVPDGD